MPSNLPRTAIPAPGLLLALLAALTGCGGSDAGAPDTVMFLPESVGDWVRLEAPVTYDRETIFDYINGAGEVYRSYAFRDVLVARYAGPDDRAVTAELFDMGTSDDAYGVFSFAREEEAPGIGSGYERKGSVLCFWQDRFYVCVAADQGFTGSEEVLEEVARGISQKLPDPTGPPALTSILPPDGLVPFSDRFFHTHQTLNYHYYLVRENVLNLSPDTDVVLARYQPGPMYLVVVAYGEEREAAEALSSFRRIYLTGSSDVETVATEGGRFVSTSSQGRFVVVVLDAGSESAADGLRQATLERLQQLLH